VSATPGVIFALQTIHVHQLYLQAIRRVERDQLLPGIAPGQWLLLAFDWNSSSTLTRRPLLVKRPRVLA